MSKEVLLKATDLVKEFNISVSGVKNNKGVVHAVSNVDLEIYKGETFALVGESGCGKSTLGRLLIRLIEATHGNVEFDGCSLYDLKPAQLRDVRKKMQLIFQDPYASLNPRMTVKEIIAEPLVTHKVYKNKEDTLKRIKELMKEVGIREEFLNRYPHQFSGGQRQRIGIARALALRNF